MTESPAYTQQADQSLFYAVKSIRNDNKFSIIVGGDHSSCVGTMHAWPLIMVCAIANLECKRNELSEKKSIEKD